tara:strand:+ start:381 stop:614 length:234 start_codon:yes stop_codon:yes gene_type:complete
MKKITTELRKLNELHTDDIEHLQYVISEFKSMIYNKKVTEKTIRDLTQLISVLTFMRNEHAQALMTWLKQGFILDED